jgi:hypothetical protein
MGFNLGNALKYIWRCDLKKDAVEDLRKARWYIDEEIKLRTEPQPLQSYTGSSNMPLNTGAGVTTPFSYKIVPQGGYADKECGK